MASDNESIKKQLRRKPVQLAIADAERLRTGSTLLDLACSGKASGGLVKGKYYFLVGDSTSGKTWVSLTCAAEASINPHFEDYEIYYDNVEDGALMDFERYFGPKMAERIRAPKYDRQGNPIYSTTVESFYFHLDDAIARAREKDRPFIYVLDSQDSLTSNASDEKFEEKKTAYEEDKDSAGSYGDGKAKAHSENIRRVIIGLRDTGSILIIIGQTRDNLGMGMAKKTRSGGRSLRFYACLEIWTSVKEKIRRNIKGEPTTIGVLVEAQIKKNRLTGKDRTVQFPIYHSYGIDDVGSCVEFLIDKGHWKKIKKKDEDDDGDKKGKAPPCYDAREFGFDGTLGQLIKRIEDEALEHDLRDLVAEVWNDIERAAEVDRKPRYA